MKSQGQLYECPWKPCSGFYPLTDQGVVKVHTHKDNPCPGGGYDTQGHTKTETTKMLLRARQMRGRLG